MKPIRRWSGFGIAIAAAVTLAACSGGNLGDSPFDSALRSVTTPNTQQRAVPASSHVIPAGKKTAQGRARISIKIPHRLWKVAPLPIGDQAKDRRHPKYISASTQSMTVVVAGGAVPAQTYNLTPASPGCSAGGGSTTCSEIAFFPTGEQTVTITLYDQTGGNGNALSQASEPVNVAAGAVTNISITLNGVPATAKVLLNGSASDSIPEGTATSLPATVTAYDADNNVILTPGNYSTPVTLSDSDGSGATSLSTTSVTAPGEAITLSYNGGSVSSATITPSINGAAKSSGAATLTFTVVTPAITEYSIPTSGSNPLGISEGPDGALWFAECRGYNVGRITTNGTITEYSVPKLGSQGNNPVAIAAGPSGNGSLWFTQFNHIGSITTGGAITEYSISSPIQGDYMQGITAGPDGNLWFTEQAVITTMIGVITTAGTVTNYTIPSGGYPWGITAGPDGNLWFTEHDIGKIGQITTGGTITEYSIPTSNSTPYGIAAGPDGALWFTECSGNKIGRITTGGTITEYSIPTQSSSPHDIAAGPDGALWFTEFNKNQIGRITTTGTITSYTIPTGSSLPLGIAAGPDQALWFTECGGNKIGRIPVAIVSPNQRRPAPAHRGMHVKPMQG